MVMSSPYIPPRGEYQNRRVMSSPPPSALSPPETREPSIRPMRLKVLYTFDNENKTNCLARWPQILNIRTAYLDEAIQVGVIELRTCIQAIVAASPELTAKLGQDYTVYAYDYSEYETPLVGQGMLSWVLASASSTPSAPAHQSNTVVTGRVCKNLLGLFGNGVQETLEVKLRLVPVPTCLQSEYIESMRKYRDLSRVMPESFDPQAWTDFLKANPGILSLVGQTPSQSPTSDSGPTQHGLERVQQLMSEGYWAPDGGSRPQIQRRNSSATTVLSGQETMRAASPTPSMQSMSTSQQALYSQYSRAPSRTSNQAPSTRARRPSTGSAPDPGYASNDDPHDDGPSRKRAKIMKADHPGKGSFGKNVDSLRVTASGAASIRVFQPTAVRPTTSAMHTLDGPPRAPTPIPQNAVQRRRPLLPAPKSNLSESLVTSDSGYRSLVNESDAISPEKGRSMSSFHSQEIPGSSPPMLRDDSVAPSSPVLPALPRPAQLERLESSIDGLFDDNDSLPIDDMYFENTGFSTNLDLTRHKSTQSESFGGQPAPSSRQLEEEAKKRELSARNARRAIGLKRSQTWAGEHPSSDDSQAPKRKPSRAGTVDPKPRGSWDKEKRKKAIQSKLNSSLEAGEMPPFCENCGAIETPTWRKAYSRLHSGDHSQVTVSNVEGGIVAVQVVETNPDGSTKTFKVYKKARTGEEDQQGYTEVLLCNPCGIWLSNRNRMRPSHLWNKDKSKDEVKKKPRRARNRRKAGSEAPQSDLGYGPSDGITLASEHSRLPLAQSASSTPKPTSCGRDSTAKETTQDEATVNETIIDITQITVDKQSEKTNTSIDSSAIAALQRAIDSSPGQSRFLGSQMSPIELDKNSPDPARRSLFKSPRTEGPLGLSASESSNGPIRPPKTPNESRRDTAHAVIEDQADKENVPPAPSTPDDGLDNLFSGFSPSMPSRSSKGIDGWKSPSIYFKTPLPKSSSKQNGSYAGDFVSSSTKHLHQPRTPSRTPARPGFSTEPDMTPFTMHLNQLLSENPNTSPSQLLGDLDTLPVMSLNGDNSLPVLADGGTPSRVFRAAGFDFGALESSDLPIPSSPPAWFGVYEDP